uniref:Transmembrane protein n=1 Tax=Caenorhabditis tropicalis TaxID=1561998 RepID=A0A1I7TWG3_9PELO
MSNAGLSNFVSNNWNATDASCESFADEMNFFMQKSKAFQTASVATFLAISILLILSFKANGIIERSNAAHLTCFVVFFLAFTQVSLFLDMITFDKFFIEVFLYVIDRRRKLCSEVPHWIGLNIQAAFIYALFMLLNLGPIFLMLKWIVALTHQCAYLRFWNTNIERSLFRNRQFVYPTPSPIEATFLSINPPPSYSEAVRLNASPAPEYESLVHGSGAIGDDVVDIEANATSSEQLA